MQRCPYIHEMRERLLDQPRETLQLENMERANLLDNRQSASESNQVGTVVKLQGDGYHTSPAHQRTPLVPHDLGEDFNLDFDDDFPIDARRPKNAKTSLFIVTSLVYAILLIVVCIAYVISDVTTHRLPVLYYETFFTYLYGVSILFLLYVFCFLLQESSCCNGGNGGSKPKPQPKEKKSKKAKNADPADSKDAKGSKDSGKAAKGAAYQEAPVDAEVAVTPKNVRKRKTTHSDLTHGSFFLRVGAIAFGLGAMIYIGLEFGSFFEIPFDSPCHHILIGVNPLLQMIFTFMQMYFIFMNARTRPPFQLNIHRFKVIARFGLMHVVATNICVWIRTLVKESLLEITIYHQKNEPEAGASSIAHSIRQHALRHAGTVLRTHAGPNSEFEVLDGEDILPKDVYKSDNVLSKLVRNTVDGISKSLGMGGDLTSTSSTTSTTTRAPFTTPNYQWHSTTMARKLKKFITSATTAATTAAGGSGTTTTSSTTISPSTTTSTIDPSSSTTTTTTTFSPFSTTTATNNNLETSSGLQRLLSSSANPPSLAPVDGFGSAVTPTSVSGSGSFMDSFLSSTLSPASSTEGSASIMNNLFGQQGPMENSFQTYSDLGHEEVTGLVSFENLESLDNIYPAALSSNIGTLNSTACGRIDIMGTIVYDSAPYLYPFIIEYSLIGAVVLYVMWKHIGRYPGRMNDEDLEHRLEVMLSRRAVAMAQQQRSGRVDCVGSSKGLFFGLLLLVGALICLILFFVLVRHQQFSLLAIYLADASHCILMAFAILAIIVGFIRVKNLKFRCEEQSNLNDILLRISAFGLFTYSVFSIIAGSLKVLESEPSLLVTTTGGVAVFQVILQLLFIADVSRRRVHLPEHDRSKPGRQIVTFLLICNVAMFAIYTFEAQKVFANPVSRYVQLEFYGFVPWSIIQRITLPLCIFHRFHSAVTLAEIWKTTYKARLE
ncbi:proton channel OtopLc isoform X1 [Drosophila takahashii]|uniref:proton channel OtopLc isoform X1 n=1 Tax=Drosophila takahashii TaxID=29030 RepID=UPI0007E6BD30|nr:proton channel OtopLc isoform X1 [Drosophila takahashii]XP_044252180.1 proton channel OtopLc isoform X1 [Drosophila takahashii]XP_044252181.1 proton channel OtopLc isoform X1 [Drosophila takahashii]